MFIGTPSDSTPQSFDAHKVRPTSSDVATRLRDQDRYVSVLLVTTCIVALTFAAVSHLALGAYMFYSNIKVRMEHCHGLSFF